MKNKGGKKRGRENQLTRKETRADQHNNYTIIRV